MTELPRSGRSRIVAIAAAAVLIPVGTVVAIRSGGAVITLAPQAGRLTCQITAPLLVRASREEMRHLGGRTPFPG